MIACKSCSVWAEQGTTTVAHSHSPSPSPSPSQTRRARCPRQWHARDACVPSARCASSGETRVCRWRWRWERVPRRKAACEAGAGAALEKARKIRAVANARRAPVDSTGRCWASRLPHKARVWMCSLWMRYNRKLTANRERECDIEGQSPFWIWSRVQLHELDDSCQDFARPIQSVRPRWHWENHKLS